MSIQASTTTTPVNNPELLTDVRLIFAIAQHLPYRSLLLTMTWLWGRWGPAELTTNLPPEHRGVLPLDLGMDLVEADQLVKAHGYIQKYWWVQVVLPQGEQLAEQVYYVFEMEVEGPGSVDAIYVGTRDRSVSVTKLESDGNGVLSSRRWKASGLSR